MSKIAVIAKITCKPGERDAAATGLQPMLDHVETEPGTLRYVLLQDNADADVLWMYELYDDNDALTVHSGSEAMRALGHAIGAHLAGRPELIFTTPIGGKGL
jgi:quinol monooxygenase YgiN